MKNPSDPDWDEFSDLDFANWKRLRAALEHENQLINQRFTWLLVLNGLLITAFGAVIGHAPPGTPDSLGLTLKQAEKLALSGLAVCGILFSIFSAIALRAAFDQHDTLKRWWLDHRSRKLSQDHPPICGQHPKLGFLKLNYHHFPIIFILMWVTLLVAGLLNELLHSVPWIVSIFPYVTIPLGIIGAVVGLLFIGTLWGRNHPKEKKSN